MIQSLTLPVATSAANFVFSKIWNDRDYESVGGSIDLSTTSENGLRIAAWGLPKDGGCRGTLIFLHGIGNHSGKQEYRNWFLPFCSKFDLALVGMDLRHHGKTGDAPPTFGAMEALDLAAVINKAENSGFPPPFIVFGESYGGMVAQRAAMDNTKIAGVICDSPPAWPWHAIAATLRPWVSGLENAGPAITRPILDALRQNALAVGHLINAAYGRDVLAEGDIRRFPASPVHRPLFLYAMGEKDPHGIHFTQQVWEHLYPDESAVFDSGPKDSPQQSKWFLRFPAGHVISRSEYAPEFWPQVDAFIERVFERQCPSR